MLDRRDVIDNVLVLLACDEEAEVAASVVKAFSFNNVKSRKVSLCIVV